MIIIIIMIIINIFIIVIIIIIILITRCSAAGYRWNPTHIQLADPNDHGFYSEECGPDTPLRCQVNRDNWII